LTKKIKTSTDINIIRGSPQNAETPAEGDKAEKGNKAIKGGHEESFQNGLILKRTIRKRKTRNRDVQEKKKDKGVSHQKRTLY